ncbi:hypothetical protein [Advenella faeciporci]|nr:hypothetical protein [Advenella faeciporci]
MTFLSLAQTNPGCYNLIVSAMQARDTRGNPVQLKFLTMLAKNPA